MRKSGAWGSAPSSRPEWLPCIVYPFWRFRTTDSHPNPGPRRQAPCPYPEHGRGQLQRTPSFHLQTCREAAPSQQMEPPSTPRPLANTNARARGIPSAAEASPNQALSGRVLHASARGWPGREGGLRGGEADRTDTDN